MVAFFGKIASMKNNFFKLLHQSSKSKARLGKINTAHGIINTPAFVPVGTKGSIKSLTPQLIKDIGVQVAFVNTYHLVTHPGVKIIEKAGGIHKFANLDIPLMSDSGGFQVFSLGNSTVIPAKAGIYSNKSSIGILATQHKGENPPAVVKISEDGVKFRSIFDGELIEFTPEKSMEFQRQIGADINMAFDECISSGADYEYTKKATERTHRWLERCVDYVKCQNLNVKAEDQEIDCQLKSSNYQLPTTHYPQFLYGIIQGGIFEDLRKKSAEFVVSQNTVGIAIGGVSVGETKKEMREQIAWVAGYLPNNKPVHLLGVGQIDDIVDLVKHGIDTFDCVEPTRKARMGELYKSEEILSRVSIPSVLASNNSPRLRAVGIPSTRATSSDYNLDIYKGIYRNNLESVDENCDCYVCQNFTKAYLHHLFKQHELLGYTLATYHNLWVMEKLFEKIRDLIIKDSI